LKFIAAVTLVFVISHVFAYGRQEIEIHKPFIVVLTDVSTRETDDSNSVVRLLVHANMFE